MDPALALANAREAAERVLDDTAITYPDNLGQDAVMLAEAFQALDGWLASGGMLPGAWHLASCMASDCHAGGSAAEHGAE